MFISENESEYLSKLFMKLDSSNDGYLSKEELMTGFKQMDGQQASQQEILELYGAMDMDGNNRIDYKEFMTACTAKQN